MMNLLEITDLSVSFPGPKGKIPAVRNLSLSLAPGECLAIVGESGCGKSVVAQSIMRLLPSGTEVLGRIMYQGQDIMHLSEREMEHIRGQEIGMVFQSPARALNPIMKIGKQLIQPQVLHGFCSEKDAELRAKGVLQGLGLDAEWIMTAYPWMCSGGMCQRIVFAAVSLLHPNLVIADEPTKGLDAANVTDLEAMLSTVTAGKRTGLLLITHDMDVASRLSNRIAVMYCGMIVEEGETKAVLSSPKHPYTRGLLGSLPKNGFVPIPGMSPALTDLPEGCVFHPRCRFADEKCRTDVPDLKDGVRCHRC
ncbi:MAG: ABC transporter ATP-binding protein [Methanocorpusculum sp.]|uniref:ABC transporter ATP-binding protein n=1 Tax=Methanocorpusculum sp. TaxID=2058474 RepID=UPI00271570C4|nr:ABC transporter ATP-binding protein [Methanocorpusculum sp.]MDO9522867.1 ABC transporter ATP-binding protein [Methanocorpusculum sp.]